MIIKRPHPIIGGLLQNIFIILMVLCTGLSSQGKGEEKKSASFLSQLFVWDIGTVPRKMDANDIILDLSKTCKDLSRTLNILEDKKILSEFKRVFDSNLKNQYSDFEQNLLNRHSIGSKEGENVSVLDSFAGGSSKVFILLPEVHNQFIYSDECNVSCALKHEAINRSSLEFNLKIIKSAKIKNEHIGNFREGVIGGPWRIEVPGSLKLNTSEHLKYLRSYGHHYTFTVIGSVFSEDLVLTSYLENYEDYYTQLLLYFSDIQSGTTFKESLSRVKKFDATIDSNKLSEVYEKLNKLNKGQISILKRDICDIRSETMAKKSIKLANDNRLNLSFISFGASHYFGLIQELKRQGYSYLTIVGKADAQELGDDWEPLILEKSKPGIGNPKFYK